MKKLIILVSLSILMITGCASSSKNITSDIDESLPKVTNIRVLSDMTNIGLEWSLALDERVVGYQIYRANHEGRFLLIKKIEDKYISHFVDTNLNPNTSYSYTMATISMDKKHSNTTEKITVKTKDLMESVPFAKAIMGLPEMIKVIWRPHPNPNVCSYIIQRNDLSKNEWKDIAEVKGRLNAEYLDKSLEDNKIYRYQIKVKTCDGVISKPSDIIQAQTKALPPSVVNVKASVNLPKKIRISWDDIGYSDLDYYQVYRANSILPIYSVIAKTKQNFYEDLVNENGASYKYKITAVDKDALESVMPNDYANGMSLARPMTPIISEFSQDEFGLRISWYSQDKRAIKYAILRTIDSNEEKIPNITQNYFIQNSLNKGMKYSFQIIAIDEFGIESKPTKEVSVKIPEL